MALPPAAIVPRLQLKLGAPASTATASRLEAWAIVVNPRLSPRELDQIRDHSGARRVLLTADVSQEAATHAAVRRLGGIDILVCSAGITGATAPVHDFPVESWRRVFDINVHGLFYCNRAVLPVMLAANYGRIVNVSSVAKT